MYKDVLVQTLEELFYLSEEVLDVNTEERGDYDLPDVRVAYNKGLDWPVRATYVTAVDSDDVNDPWVTFVWYLTPVK